MNKTHTFIASLTWKKNDIPVETDTKIYIKNHTVQIVGKPELALSAAKAFKGDPNLYNPEDLLLTSLVSCHMMSYLYVCAQHGIEVLTYTDEAKATLETYADGSGKIVEVKLHPIVTISDKMLVDKALSLHTQANKLCFIANSCNFPVLHAPHCKVNVE